MRPGPKPQPLEERIYAQIEIGSSGCWNWTGYVNPNGYGRIKVNGTTENAHRVAYRTLIGDFAPHLHVDHLCRNRRCVNPLHLEPVTIAENQRRGPGSITHCKHGHRLAGDNLQERADGRRICKACHRVQARESYRRLHGDGGTRTLKVSPPPDFESGAFTAFATSPDSATGAQTGDAQ